MSELIRASTTSNDTVVEVEDFNPEVNTFREIFGNSDVNIETFKKPDRTEKIKEIQQTIRAKKEEIQKLSDFIFSKSIIQDILLWMGFSVSSSLLPVPLLNELNLTTNAEGIVFLVMGSLPSIAIVLYMALVKPKNLKKVKILKDEIKQLYREILQINLEGKIVGNPELNYQWNIVKIKKNNKITERMAKLVLDESGNTIIETRELKQEKVVNYEQ